MYRISAIAGEGCRELTYDLMQRLDELNKKAESHVTEQNI